MDKAANDNRGRTEPSDIGKAASYLNRIISPVSTYIAYIGAAALGSLVLMLMYRIFSRRLFNAPLTGSFELTELALVAITFLILSYDSLHHESMVVEIVVDRFPKGVRAIIGAVIHFLTTVMLGVLSWQLVVQGIRIQNFGQTTVVLELPVYPFLYLAAFGILLLTVVYLKHFLYSLDKAVNGW
jgi:TRAP-type C4-dicarboxylate transport system permease small subunit